MLFYKNLVIYYPKLLFLSIIFPMIQRLKSESIAILATDGVEQAPLEEPRMALNKNEIKSELISIHDGKIKV